VTIEEAINLGAEKQRAGLLADAEALYRHALALQPDLLEGHFNLGTVLDRLGRWPEAIAAFRETLRIRPDFPRAHWNLGASLLRQGDFANGFAEYEWRAQVPELRINRIKTSRPQWRGEELRGRRILLYAEQGFGDSIQFARFVPEVARRGGKVLLGCQRDLTALLGRLPGVETCLPQPGPAPADFSYHCTLPSLPYALGTTLSTIPAPRAYLRPDPTKSELWRGRIAKGAQRRVGLVWAGRPTHQDDMNRSIALSRVAPLAAVANVQWFSLQKGPAAQVKAEFPVPMVDWTAELKDYDDTAAMIEHLDLIITVDTSVAHLAGALGRPAWVLIPLVPDWRWMLERNDSPWYPTLRLFRQPRIGDWETTVALVAEALKNA